jgi:hypothetical protein
MGSESETEDEAPGWDAITSVLAPLYPGQEPRHYGTVLPYAFGGPDPIQGISVYQASPPDHWHFVTYGFSELYAKENDDLETSGYGFELTLRLARCGPEPPMFAMSFLQNLARYVFDTGRTFASGDHMDLNGPIEAGSSTAITAICFAQDPDLPGIVTPNGSLEFLQIVGLTADELVAVKAWHTDPFLELLAERAPKMVTDTERASFLTDAEFGRRVADGTDRDGSSTAVLFVDGLAVTVDERARPLVTVGAQPAKTVSQVLPSRLRHGRTLEIQGPAASVIFESADQSSVAFQGQDARIRLNRAGVSEFVRALDAVRGRRELRELPEIVVEVVPTEIKDRSGKVVRVVG